MGIKLNRGITYFVIAAILATSLFVLVTWRTKDKLASQGHSVAGVKIFTREAGVYEINVEELTNLGLIESPQELEDLRLLNRGQQLDLWIDERSQYVRFYAGRAASAYSLGNIYLLVDEKQVIRYASESGLSGSGIPELDYMELPVQEGYYLANIHLEENEHYQPQVEVGGDHWLWETIYSGNSQSIPITLDKPGSGVGFINVSVWSSTEASVSPDHHLRLAINGSVIVDESWDGRGQHFLLGEIEPGVLREGENEVVIEAPGDLDILADLYSLNWIEIIYPRQPLAISDRLEFTQPDEQLPLRGFSGLVSIYEIPETEQAKLVATNIEPESFKFISGRRYLVVGPAGYLQTKGMVPFKSLDFEDETFQGAEYLAIGPESLLAPLQPLLDYHSSQGLRTHAVSSEAIFDGFNGGYPEPGAIANFIRYAHANWEIQPKYILLVGDASYDPKSYQSTGGGNLLPAYFIDTIFGGETVSDVIFGQVNTDPWPDLAIGLLPARTQDQIRVLVEKTLNFENNRAHTSNSSHVVAIADGQEQSFSRDAQAFLDYFSEVVNEELFAPTPGDSAATDRIVQYFKAGPDILAYFGHGSVRMWGKDRLFTTEDVAHLNNSQQPTIVINMTCLTGLYTHPDQESLAEALLWTPKGGAVAVLAPSSLTLPSDQSFLTEALVKALINDESLTLGSAHLKARRAIVLESDGALDVMRTFMLFGDPALQLHFK